VNFKDGPGIDPQRQGGPHLPDRAASIWRTSGEAAGEFAAGTEVLAHGYDLGVARHGGFAEYAGCRPTGWWRFPPG